MNPFGVHHEPLSKAYKNIAGRLARTRNFPKKDDSLADRMGVNYTQWREKSGFLAREVNPRRWEANDAANLKAGLGPPSKMSLKARAKGEASARKKARALKEASQAAVTGRANARKSERFLP